MPLTTSFPSGHAASASAFTTGVAIESRGLAAAIAPVAGAVAFSRVYVGVHYPLDVAAGAFLGAAVAWLTRNQFPAVPWEAERSSPSRDHRPQVTDSRGAGLAIVVNSDSGSAAGAPVEDQLQEDLPAAEVIEPGTDGLQQALESAADGSRAIGVAGGDGTVAAAAGVAADRDVPLVLLATGTLNHLARDAHLDRTDDALAAYREGDAIGVDLATVGESTFINTLTLGAYPRMLELRERLARYIGRWPAHLAAAAWTLGSCGPVDLRLDGEAREILMAYIGNCAHEPAGFAPSWRPRLDDGLLDIRILHAEVPLARLRLIAAIFTGTLPRCAAYERRLAPRLTVETDLDELTVTRDGDIHTAPATFEVAKRPRALTLFAPSVPFRTA